ncbi:MAG TPA: 5-methyltetrahydropteroyltriglutamate--homocysteine methyltransferase, partial [Lachnospiraceae bacterium]|nr:5-methyltetrahydropteroyltriglutamate--homocysteine methyltransferase [Lachnospiraceae bacterium]
MNKNAPFRFDIVGSFLRPEYLKKARAEFADKKITSEELKNIEDTAITDLIKKQKEVGLQAITDGEFRRSSWHLDFMWAFNGVGHQKTKEGIPFHGEPALIDDTYLTGKV